MSDKVINRPELTAEKTNPIIFNISAEIAEKCKNLLSEVIINPNKPEPEPEVLLYYRGTPVLWQGCKSFVCAVAKARKTTTLTLLTAILCGRDEANHGFNAKQGCSVLYVDTEQARVDSQRILQNVAKLCDKEATELPLNVLSLNKLSPEEIRGVIEVAVKTYHPNVLILDNWTDCISSVLDDKECTEFSRQLRLLAEVYQIGIFSVIHANESARHDSTPNFRGWGAEEARKSDLTLFLKDKGDYSEATFGRCRGKRPEGFLISRTPDSEALPCIYEGSATKEINPDKYSSVVAQIPPEGLLPKELIKVIENNNGVTERTARNAVSTMSKAGVIKKGGARYYNANNVTTNEPIELPF